MARLLATRWLTSASSTSAWSRPRSRSAVRLDALFERGVEQLDLIAGLRRSRWHSEEGDGDAADNQHDDDPPTIETQRSSWRWRAARRRRSSAVHRCADDAGQEDDWPRPSAPCRGWCETAPALRRPEARLSGDRVVHFPELFRNHVRQPLDHAAGLRRRSQRGLQMLEMGLGLRLGLAVGGQVDFVASDQKAALARTRRFVTRCAVRPPKSGSRGPARLRRHSAARFPRARSWYRRWRATQ